MMAEWKIPKLKYFVQRNVDWLFQKARWLIAKIHTTDSRKKKKNQTDIKQFEMEQYVFIYALGWEFLRKFAVAVKRSPASSFVHWLVPRYSQ